MLANIYSCFEKMFNTAILKQVDTLARYKPVPLVAIVVTHSYRCIHAAETFLDPILMPQHPIFRSKSCTKAEESRLSAQWFTLLRFVPLADVYCVGACLQGVRPSLSLCAWLIIGQSRALRRSVPLMCSTFEESCGSTAGRSRLPTVADLF